ncbi:MAG: hypothetical protein GY772_27180, partial [bacterium]|nr:hypothetical protein [bacterium]
TTPAVAGPPGLAQTASAAAAPAADPNVWTLDDIRFEAPRAHQPFALNNTALKWLRFLDEAPEGNPTIGERPVDLGEPNMDIGVLLRGRGPAFCWQPGAVQPWSWRLFVLSLDEETQRTIIGDGIVRLAAQATSFFSLLLLFPSAY